MAAGQMRAHRKTVVRFGGELYAPSMPTQGATSLSHQGGQAWQSQGNFRRDRRSEAAQSGGVADAGRDGEVRFFGGVDASRENAPHGGEAGREVRRLMFARVIAARSTARPGTGCIGASPVWGSRIVVADRRIRYGRPVNRTRPGMVKRSPKGRRTGPGPRPLAGGPTLLSALFKTRTQLQRASSSGSGPWLGPPAGAWS